jgi:dephospho-CoA kinase
MQVAVSFWSSFAESFFAVATISANENNLRRNLSDGADACGRRPVIGVVGGVGSGKSSVLRAVERLKLQIIDADRIGHEELRKSLIRNRLVQEFGTQILDESGEIHRTTLAGLVFGTTPQSQLNRERLNAIVRPGIRAEIRRQIQQASQDVDAIILDAALLLEAGWAGECDALVFIETPLVLRQERVATHRDWTAEDLARREASQWDLGRKRSACGYLVDNSGTLQDAGRQLTEHLQSILKNADGRTDLNPGAK